MIQERIYLPEREKGRVTVLENGDNIVAFCTTCRQVISVGNDKKGISRSVMYSQIRAHREAFSSFHSIDIVKYLKQEGEGAFPSRIF